MEVPTIHERALDVLMSCALKRAISPSMSRFTYASLTDPQQGLHSSRSREGPLRLFFSKGSFAQFYPSVQIKTIDQPWRALVHNHSRQQAVLDQLSYLPWRERQVICGISKPHQSPFCRVLFGHHLGNVAYICLTSHPLTSAPRIANPTRIRTS